MQDTIQETEDVNFGDIRKSWDRIGGRYIYRKIAMYAIWSAAFTFIAISLSILLIQKATTEVQYKDAIASVRYQNIKR